MTITASTPLINVETGEYPVYLMRVRQAFPQTSFAFNPTEEALLRHGFAVVHPTPRPMGDVVTEGVAPSLVDGVYYQTWDVRAFNEQELAKNLEVKKAVLSGQVLHVRERDLENGFTYTDIPEMSFGVQIRHEDRLNILGLHVVVKDLIAAGSSELQEFRSAENISYWLTPEQTLALTITTLANYNAIMKASWVLKNQIDGAKTLSELPVIPETLVGFVG